MKLYKLLQNAVALVRAGEGIELDDTYVRIKYTPHLPKKASLGQILVELSTDQSLKALRDYDTLSLLNNFKIREAVNYHYGIRLFEIGIDPSLYSTEQVIAWLKLRNL